MLILNELFLGFQSLLLVVLTFSLSFFKPACPMEQKDKKLIRKDKKREQKRPNFPLSESFLKPNSVSEPPAEQESFDKFHFTSLSPVSSFEHSDGAVRCC